MNPDCCDLIITIDTRENSAKRIKSIYDYYEPLGACVIEEALKRCDYQIEGTYNDKEINLGIEYKTLNDISGSFMDLPWKLAESYDLYSDVALFVELGKYDLSDMDSGSVFRNYHVQKKYGIDGTFRYQTYQNLLRTFNRDGVYVQEFQSVFEFPRSILNLMEYITKEEHKGISFKNEDYESQFKNVLMRIPGIGAKNAMKGMKAYHNLYEIALLHESHLQETWGNKLGKNVYEFMRHDLNTGMIDNE